MIGAMVMILPRHTGVSWIREETAQFQWKYQQHHHRTCKWGCQHRWHGSLLLIKNLQNSHVASEVKYHAGVDYQCHWRDTLHNECISVVEHDNDLLSDSTLKHMVLTHCLTYYQLCVLGERKKPMPLTLYSFSSVLTHWVIFQAAHHYQLNVTLLFCDRWSPLEPSRMWRWSLGIGS